MEYLVDLVKADVVGFVVQLCFAFTIIVMIADKQKPPITSCVITGVLSIALGVGGSFAATLPAFLAVVNGILWFVLGFQRWRQHECVSQ